MRAFVIADASKRKAKPIALLLWMPHGDESDQGDQGDQGDESDQGDQGDQGLFALQLSQRCDERDLPLSLSFCIRRKNRCATSEESEQWVRSRIVPESRHNITEVLRANGLSRYDEVSLLAACKGRSSDDDYLAYEVELPSEVEEALVGGDSAVGSGFACGSLCVDKVLDSFERRRRGPEVHYAFVGLEPATDASGNSATCDENGEVSAVLTAARRIGMQIRARRLEAGFTQKQLAVRAGIAQSVLSRIESGSGNPTLSLLEELAAALDTKVDVTLRVL